jgi:DNA-binding PadR family transcriptional regulator
MGNRARLPSPDCTRIAILGLLCRHGPQHGYELRKLVVEQHIDEISDIQLGSIYAALKRFAQEGLVEQQGRSRSGNRPTRTMFRITDLGKKELRTLVADAFTDPQQAERPVDLALHFSGLLEVDDVVELLEERLMMLEKFAKLIERATKSTRHDDPAVRDLIRDIPDHFRRINRAEIAWTKHVLDNARNGAYRTGPVHLR